VTQVDNAFLSTFIHELVNALNGVQTVAQILENAEVLNREDIEDSSADLYDISDNANKLVNKLRLITNKKRVLASPSKSIKALCSHALPKKGQLPKRLKVSIEKSVNDSSSMPEALFNGLVESVFYVLLHQSDDSFLAEQNVTLSYQPEASSLNFSFSNTATLPFIQDLTQLEAQLVATSKFGFELKTLFYACQLYSIEVLCQEHNQGAHLQLVFSAQH